MEDNGYGASFYVYAWVLGYVYGVIFIGYRVGITYKSVFVGKVSAFYI